jgi:hypothetical protein
MSTTTTGAVDNEVTILLRLLCNEEGLFPPEVARYLLDRGFSERDKARMHDLVVRNQAGRLTAAEKEEMFAFGKAGSVLSILKSKARRTLGIKIEDRAEA